MSAERSGEISNVDRLPFEALGFLRFARRLMCVTSPQREGETSRFSRNDISPGCFHSSLSKDLAQSPTPRSFDSVPRDKPPGTRSPLGSGRPTRGTPLKMTKQAAS